MRVQEPARSKALAAIEKRYQQWRDEQARTIAELPEQMQYEVQYKDAMIRLGELAKALHRDVDQIVNTHAAPKTVEGWQRGAYRDEQPAASIPGQTERGRCGFFRRRNREQQPKRKNGRGHDQERE